MVFFKKKKKDQCLVAHQIMRIYSSGTENRADLVIISSGWLSSRAEMKFMEDSVVTASTG